MFSSEHSLFVTNHVKQNWYHRIILSSDCYTGNWNISLLLLIIHSSRRCASRRMTRYKINANSWRTHFASYQTLILGNENYVNRNTHEKTMKEEKNIRSDKTFLPPSIPFHLWALFIHMYASILIWNLCTCISLMITLMFW